MIIEKGFTNNYCERESISRGSIVNRCDKKCIRINNRIIQKPSHTLQSIVSIVIIEV